MTNKLLEVTDAVTLMRLKEAIPNPPADLTDTPTHHAAKHIVEKYLPVLAMLTLVSLAQWFAGSGLLSDIASWFTLAFGLMLCSCAMLWVYFSDTCYRANLYDHDSIVYFLETGNVYDYSEMKLAKDAPLKAAKRMTLKPVALSLSFLGCAILVPLLNIDFLQALFSGQSISFPLVALILTASALVMLAKRAPKKLAMYPESSWI